MKKRNLTFLRSEKLTSKRCNQKETPSKLDNITLTVLLETANQTNIGTQTVLSSISSSEWNCQVWFYP